MNQAVLLELNRNALQEKTVNVFLLFIDWNDKIK